MKKEYNGWSSHSAWNVVVWLNNDECDYNNCQKIFTDAKEKSKNPKAWALNMLCKYYEGGRTPDGIKISRRSLKEYLDAEWQ